MTRKSHKKITLRAGSWFGAATAFLMVTIAFVLIIPVFAQQPVSVHYEYDRLNRLTKVIFDNSGASISYTYDSAGNRTATIVQGTNIQPVLTSLSPDSISAGTQGFTFSV